MEAVSVGHITRDLETFLCENYFNALRFHHGIQGRLWVNREIVPT